MLSDIIKTQYRKFKVILSKRRMRFDLLTSFFIMQLITVISITTFMYDNHTKTLINTSEVLMKSVAKQKVAQILSRFEQVGTTLTLGSHLISSDKAVDPQNGDLVKFMVNYVKKFPYTESVFIALQSGRFFQIKLIQPKTPFRTIPGRNVPKSVVFALRVLDMVDKKKTESWYYIDHAFQVVEHETLPETEITLNFFGREWYKNAFEYEALSWSSIYIFSTVSLPGIAASFPIRDANNKIIGVIGSDILLRSVSEILAENSFDGVSLILNNSGDVVAHPTEKETAKVVGQEVKLMHIENLPQKYILTAFENRKKNKIDHMVYNHDFRDFIGYFINFDNDLFKDWLFLSVAPVDVFIGTVKTAQTKVLYICLLILIFSTFVISYMTLKISRPIHALVEQADRIRVFNLNEVPIVRSGIVEIQKLQDSIYRMRRSLEAFGKFVPKSLVRSLLEKDTEVKIGGKKKRVTLFFSDIEGFTSISEASTADRLMVHLSEYFDELSSIIIKDSGTIDKYIGDAIMAFWGAPNADVRHSLHACKAALLIQKRLVDLNRKWIYDKKSAFNTRIGIHTGEVIVGNLGSAERMNYTVIGDAVNLASRLEGVNKNYGTKIIISEAVYKDIEEQAIVRPLDIVSVKGKNEGVAIYELIALTGTDPYLLPTNDELDMCHMFQKAFKHYYEQRWDDAIAYFTKLSHRFPSDIPTQMYLKRCQHFKESPPGKDWDHIHHLHEK